MIALLLILIPLIGGLVNFFIKKKNLAKIWSLVVAMLTFVIAIFGVALLNHAPEYLVFKTQWLGDIGSSFSIKADAMGMMLSLLTAFSFPIIFISGWKDVYQKSHNFFGLMLLAQAGITGVFLAMDALLFYFFWELALIPVYFLCSQWGGEKRIAVTFKFFIYTFLGSLLMLVGLIYIWSKNGGSFDIAAFYTSGIELKNQLWLFWLLFAAFAIKMPVFPFHTWQPDTYEQSPTSVTAILNAVMAKMGVLGLLRWLLPVLPLGAYVSGDNPSTLAVIGIVYASVIAFRQDDIKRLVAYSSIAHIGLMCVAIFSIDKMAIQGVMFQMFAHGINILGMWIVVGIIERKFATRKISQLGGVAQKAPALAIAFFIIMLANISLPLTNSFVGEFLMLNGIFNSKSTLYGMIFGIIAALGVVLSVVYMFRMARKVFLGNTNELTESATDIDFREKIVFGIIIAIIIVMGIFPQLFLNITETVSDSILKGADITPFIKK
jgi:NADH-quinone oxidoreductase subunit M